MLVRDKFTKLHTKFKFVLNNVVFTEIFIKLYKNEFIDSENFLY